MSELKVNKISPRSGTAVTLGDSGDTFTIPSGATLAIAGTVTGFTSAGIDDNATSTAITIDSSENVGINVTNPGSFYSGSNNLVVKDGISIFDTIDSRLEFVDGTSGSEAYVGNIVYNHASNFMRFGVDVSERMRIDSSGNLLVGTTSASISDIGSKIFPSGAVVLTRDGNAPLFLNRKSSDGDIAIFHKDGTSVGSIRSEGGDIVVGNDTRGLKYRDADIIPRDMDNTTSDNQVTLGSSGSRFADIYLGGGAFLGGTAAANKLDDYEEGTWTPYPTAGLSSFTVSAGNSRYVKIGSFVHVQAYVTGLTGKTSAQLILNGLPYTAKSFANGVISAGTNGHQGFVMTTSATTQLEVFYTNATDSTRESLLGNDTDNYLIFSVGYYTDN